MSDECLPHRLLQPLSGITAFIARRRKLTSLKNGGGYAHWWMRALPSNEKEVKTYESPILSLFNDFDHGADRM